MNGQQLETHNDPAPSETSPPLKTRRTFLQQAACIAIALGDVTSQKHANLKDPNEYTRVAFYIAAHQDDWELFRGDQAFRDVRIGTKVVFVYTTAGDYGLARGRSTFLWQDRESGAIAVADACVGGSTTGHRKTISVAGHSISCYENAGTRSYFLRLPDGNTDSNGFPSTGNVSLRTLQDHGTPIHPVDGAAPFTSWWDLVHTIQSICRRESQDTSKQHPWINAADFNATFNPGDHPDHQVTANAIHAFAWLDGYRRFWWHGYCSANESRNLGEDGVKQKFSTFQAYIKGQYGVMVEFGTPRNSWPGLWSGLEWDQYGGKSLGRRCDYAEAD
jgi:hypothetical protein